MARSIFSTLALAVTLVSSVLAVPHSTFGSGSGSGAEERIVARAPASFKHPGVLNSLESLNFVKTKVNAGEQPWKDAFDSMMASNYGSLTRTPHPSATIVSILVHMCSGGKIKKADEEKSNADRHRPQTSAARTSDRTPLRHTQWRLRGTSPGCSNTPTRPSAS